MISSTAEYALRAALYLARFGGTGPVRVEEIADALAVPRNYLSKVLGVLARRGLLRSLRGPHGGFELAVPASSLSLGDVVGAFVETETRPSCLLGGAACVNECGCPVRERWEWVAGEYAAFFRETCVQDVAGGVSGSRDV